MKGITGGRLLQQSRHDAAQAALKMHRRSHDMSVPNGLNGRVAIITSCRLWAASVSPSLSIVVEQCSPQPSVSSCHGNRIIIQ